MARIAYGTDPNQFGELHLPDAPPPFAAVVNIHGGFWRSAYGLAMYDPLCASLAAKGFAVWNMEYRRVGNPGGGWPGTFQDVRSAYRFLSQIAGSNKLNLAKVLIMGHSAGGHLALCLTAHEPQISRVISLAGVVDLQQASDLRLGNNAVADFLGGSLKQVPEHFQEADPMQLPIKATQWLIHGASDDVVPSSLSRHYAEQKKTRGEDVHYLEIASAGHFDLIDPHSAAWPKIESTITHLLS